MQLPVGYDDFGKVLENELDFIDKTLFIKEVMEDKTTEAMVITRPRRFGKTFNLSLLYYFLAAKVYGRVTEGLFQGLKIAQYTEVMKHQGQYPVVFITFKDVKEANYQNAKDNFAMLFSNLYLNHMELSGSSKLELQHKENFQKIVQKKANEIELKSALNDLIFYLYLHHDKKPWLLIDEYDTPIQEAYVQGYYDDMILFMRGLLGSLLKNNPYLNKAVLTGILRVSKESLFSGVNNLKVYSVLQQKYSEYFGFTEAEVDEILKKSHLTEKAVEIKEWYNGYSFGGITIYNPWSIANCIKEAGNTGPYWVNTSDNILIKKLLKKSPLTFKIQFESLVSGHTVEKFIDEQLSFQFLANDPEATWNLLFMAGYLTSVSTRLNDQGIFAEVAIPNREVRILYRQIIEQWLSNGYGIEWYNEFIGALLQGNMNEFQDHLEKVLLQIASVHDMAKEPEAFYHGLLLGFLASLHRTHNIQSNRESGLGRFDILILPKDLTQMGVVIELKVKGKKETLKTCAQKALEQIEHKKYIEVFKQHGIESVFQIGIGFEGKTFALAYLS